MPRKITSRPDPIRRSMARRHTRGPCSLLLLTAALAACSAEPRVGVGGTITFPLPACGSERELNCSAALFASPEDIGPRYPDSFPQRYLELWDDNVRSQYCGSQAHRAAARESTAACVTRLEAVSNYLNPSGKQPPPGMFAVALEGGGNKSAPFNLGVLAGLQEVGALPNTVGAIASVSGGSYAASFLFNRLLDKSSGRADAGDYADWFRSCIPDEFADDIRSAANTMFANLKNSARPLPVCGEQHRLPTASPCDPFLASYRYQGHVWMQPDLIMGTSANGLKRSDGFYDAWDPMANTVALFAESVVALPWQTVSRSIFRWPGNSSPTKFAYTNGLEREYGYSPSDWQAIEKCDNNALTAWADDAALVADVRNRRMQARTMQALGSALKKFNDAPDWIIGSSSPGPISATQWIGAPTRDPIRHQFELTVNGYGSGIHGYAKLWPVSGDGTLESDLLAPGSLFPPSSSMPIVEAVVASAAFFDDDQSALSQQPQRFALSTAQHFLDLGWYKEIPNFNASDASRVRQRLTPYPLYLHWTNQYSTEPYIHLHDGGNSDNSAIMPLLRRGYRTIFYAHGNQDSQATFPEICHLKNQLELDGHYYIESSTLEGIVKQFNLRLPNSGRRQFATYLDQICTEQLDGSDLATFDHNAARPRPEQRSPAVAKLLCGRIGDAAAVEQRTVDGKQVLRTDPDPSYTPCSEFTRKFDTQSASPSSSASDCAKPTPCTYRIVTDLFYRWAGDSIRFEVYRGDALQHQGGTPNRSAADLLSTIIAVVPALSAQDVAQQLTRDAGPSSAATSVDSAPTLPRDNCDPNPWKAYCDQAPALQKQLRISACTGPGKDTVLPTASATSAAKPITPCTALAHIVATRCNGRLHPAFPQDSIYLETWNTSYTTYASYFDLGRYQAQRAFQDRDTTSPAPLPTCPMPPRTAPAPARSQ